MTQEVEERTGPPAGSSEPLGGRLSGGSDGRTESVREDFLFHLYRGSELLYDNRPLEAKAELEHALTLEPNDPRGRGLLAVVYFRVGEYVRGAALYEGLLREQPDELAIRVNLALCQLKAGKPELAEVQLQHVVRVDPSHVRAWGYLGLALERLGRLGEAIIAFKQAGQHDMAQRMIDRGAATTRGGLVAASEPAAQGVAVRVDDLDAGELDLTLAGPGPGQAVEAAEQPRNPVVPRQRRLDTVDWGAPSPRGVTWLEPPALRDFLTDVRLEPSVSGQRVRVLGNRLARVDIDASSRASGFALRLDAVRSYTGVIDPDILSRQSRGSVDGETFGGVGTPFVSIHGPGHAVLGPRASQRVAAFEMENGVVFVRREALLGFELSLSYENGRLPLGDGDAAPLVQLRGDGAVLLELASELIAIDVGSGGNLTVRKEVLVGWVGRLLPRTLPMGEAPCGQRGLIAFSGDGTVLLAGK